MVLHIQEANALQPVITTIYTASRHVNKMDYSKFYTIFLWMLFKQICGHHQLSRSSPRKPMKTAFAIFTGWLLFLNTNWQHLVQAATQHFHNSIKVHYIQVMTTMTTMTNDAKLRRDTLLYERKFTTCTQYTSAIFVILLSCKKPMKNAFLTLYLTVQSRLQPSNSSRQNSGYVQGGPKKTGPFLKVCNSCIWWRRKAFNIPKCSAIN